ncbi:carboxylesterase family protein [Bacteroidales bacterium OttesenSCG-928-B11]|nr:carboxylesterase family protein [Bacteroidales bacterium OttesenSCG-928-C03]MDL2311970.1 carboxylesterase family protein [Bacteroidales bacterium OttesenSCG-928-B11]
MKNKAAIAILAFFITACAPEVYKFGSLPPNTVIKGTAKEGVSLYIVRDTDSITLTGNIFAVSDAPYTEEMRYESDYYGNMTVQSKETAIPLKILSEENSDNFKVLIPKNNPFGLKKQKVTMSFSHHIYIYTELKNRYKEYIFDSIVSQRNVLYGKASGYYTSRNLNDVPNDDYMTMASTVLKDITANVMRKGLTEQNLLLDIHQPYNDHYDKRPVFVYIHGGAFLFGDKENRLQWALTRELVKRGYVFVSLNYRLGFNLAGFKSVERSIYRGVQDARAALRYLTHHSNQLNIDPDQIYLGGSSAGGIIALTAAYMDEDEKYDVVYDRKEPLGNLDASGNILSDPFKISGVAALWGAVTDLSIIDNPGIPTLLFHGTKDDIVPHQEGLPFKTGMGDFWHSRLSSNWRLYGSEMIYNHMRERNMPAKYIAFEGYGHEPQVAIDGSFNNNIETINSELQHFLFTNITKNDPQYRIAGSVFVRKTDPLPVYSLPEWSDEIVEWHAIGGFILNQDSQSASVVWFDNISEHRLIAHIYDKKGREFKREIKVTVY